MPTKKNFLGGQQNYDPANGEYESNLVNSKGKVVTDADGDGISHEAKSKKDEDKEFISKYGGEKGSHRGWTDIDKDNPVDMMFKMEDEGVDIGNLNEVKEYLGATLGLDREDQDRFIKAVKESGEFDLDSWDEIDHGDDVEKYTGREPGGVKGDFDRAGFASEVVDDKTLKVYGMNGNEYTIKENENAGFDVYLGDKKIVSDVNANRENVSTKLLQWEQSNTNNPMNGMNVRDFDKKEQDFNDPIEADRYKAEEKDFNEPKSAEDKYSDYKEKGKSTWNQKLSKGQKVVIKDKDGNDMEAYVGGFYKNQKLQDEDTYEEGKDNLWHDFRGVQLVDKNGKEIGNINANQIERLEDSGSFGNKKEKILSRVDVGNNNEFLRKHNLDKDYYFDGDDLVDKKTGATLPVSTARNPDEATLLKRINESKSSKPSYIPQTKVEKDVDKWVEENWHSLDKDMPLGFMVDEIPVRAAYPVVLDALTKSMKSRVGKVEKK